MEVMKQPALALVSYVLMARSAIRLVLLLLMGSVRLVTTVQLGSQLGHHHHMFAHVETGVLQAMAVLEDANLDTIKMNSNKTLARNALNDTTAMPLLVE